MKEVPAAWLLFAVKGILFSGAIQFLLIIAMISSFCGSTEKADAKRAFESLQWVERAIAARNSLDQFEEFLRRARADVDAAIESTDSNELKDNLRKTLVHYENAGAHWRQLGPEAAKTKMEEECKRADILRSRTLNIINDL